MPNPDTHAGSTGPAPVEPTQADRWEREYARCLERSQATAWTLDEVFGGDAKVDLDCHGLPERMSHLSELEGLDATGRRTASQVMGHAYVHLFAFVEEYIIAMAIRQATPPNLSSPTARRALLRMAEEEVKHQQMFEQYQRLFTEAFGPAAVLSDAKTVAGHILSKSPLAVMLASLHLELVTQHHYVTSVKNELSIDPLFASMLKHHWIEEAQHAKLDALELKRMLSLSPAAERARAVEDYLAIVADFGTLLDQQAELDLDTLGARLGIASAGPFGRGLQAHIATVYRQAFLAAGMKHPAFVGLLSQFGADALGRVAASVPQ